MTQTSQTISQMEARLDQQIAWLQTMELLVETGFSQLTDASELFRYYGSKDWWQHLEADRAGQLPSDLKRGVLSEDGIYNALTDYQTLATTLITLGQAMQDVLTHSAEQTSGFDDET